MKTKPTNTLRILIFILLLVPCLASAAGRHAAGDSKTILFFGNSLTAGYGLDPAMAFPALIQHKIDEKGLKYQAVNGGLSGETSAGGLSRIGWMLKQRVDIFVLELGANDGLRGLPLDQTHKNLQGIIDKVKAKYPKAKIVLAGMMVPPNMGDSYQKAFARIYPALAQKNHATLIPFLLKDVAGIPDLNQADGIHPNVKGEKIVAETVWQYLEPLLTID